MSVEIAPALPDFLAAHMPFERASWRFESGPESGRWLHYIDHGDRDAQVVWMQHGNPTWSFLWRKVIAALDPKRFRCIAPDMLGFGLSSKLPNLEDHSLDRHAEALGALFDGLDLKNVILVGQDWGGPMVTNLGARFEDRVGALVLGNTSVLAPKRPRGTAFHRFAHTPVVSDFVFKTLGFPQNALWMAQGERDSIKGDVARAYMWPLRRPQERSGPLALARMVPNSPQHPSMAGLQSGEAWVRGFEGPQALVWGTRDPILGRIVTRHVRALPQASVTHCNAGRFLQEQVPHLLARAIESVADRMGKA